MAEYFPVAVLCLLCLACVVLVVTIVRGEMRHRRRCIIWQNMYNELADELREKRRRIQRRASNEIQRLNEACGGDENDEAGE